MTYGSVDHMHVEISFAINIKASCTDIPNVKLKNRNRNMYIFVFRLAILDYRYRYQ